MNVGVLAGVGPGPAPDTTATGGALPDSGQNALLVAGNRKEVSFSTTTAQAVALTDCSDYRWVSVQINNQGTSSLVAFQGSNDNVNWYSVYMMSATGMTSAAVSSSISALAFYAPLQFRYFRLNITGISSGTTSGVIEFFSVPPTPQLQTVYIGGGSVTVGAGNTSSSDALSSGFSGNPNTGFAITSNLGYNGASWDRLRTPAIFKTATATASGDTALWTPTSGKKFRLMRYQIQITGDASTASGAVIDILLRDATTSIAVGYSLYVPATAVSALGADNSEWIDMGNGFLSAAANNVLNINLSAALATGKVRVVVAGTEE